MVIYIINLRVQPCRELLRYSGISLAFSPRTALFYSGISSETPHPIMLGVHQPAVSKLVSNLFVYVSATASAVWQDRLDAAAAREHDAVPSCWSKRPKKMLEMSPAVAEVAQVYDVNYSQVTSVVPTSRVRASAKNEAHVSKGTAARSDSPPALFRNKLSLTPIPVHNQS